jgi:hypothetical protein
VAGNSWRQISFDLRLSFWDWTAGIDWDLDHFGIGLPFMSFSIEWPSDGAWQWAWSFARLTIWKTEFRLDLDLNIWFLGVYLGDWRDFGIYLGPLNIQIETGKGFDEDFPPGVPVRRLFFPPGYSIRPWPPRCRCCPPPNRLQCDDVTDFVAIHNGTIADG